MYVSAAARPFRFVMLARLSAAFFVVWATANLPALRDAWWYLDDFGISDVREPLNIDHHLEQGRPGQLLWMTTFLLDGAPDRTFANLALRLLQGLVHAVAAGMVGVLVGGPLGRTTALLAGLPFLLWPHNGEVVLWRAAGEYGVAAVLSLLAVYRLRLTPEGPLPRRRFVFGACCVGAAMLTHQLAAFAGFAVWCLAAGLALVAARPPSLRRLGQEVASVMAGHVVGGLVSWAIAHSSRGDPFRLTPASNPIERLFFVGKLDAIFITSPILYPRWIAGLQLALVGVLLLVPLLCATPKAGDRRRALLATGVAATALFTPYAAMLPVAEKYVSWRLFYLAPLVFSAIVAVCDWAFAARPLLRGGLRILVGGLVIGYFGMTWTAASVYPRLFEADLRLLRRIESYVVAAGTDAVCVVPPSLASPRTLDPHGLGFGWGGPKLSAFLGSPYPFLRWFSWLELLEEQPTLTLCLRRCQGLPPAIGFRMVTLEDRQTVCLCPP